MILAGAALTGALLRLLHKSRAAAAAQRANPRNDIEDRLREFEDAYEQATGERLTTASFYDRFCAGEFDTRFGARWATYYEATLSRSATHNGLSYLGLQRPTRG